MRSADNSWCRIEKSEKRRGGSVKTTERGGGNKNAKGPDLGGPLVLHSFVFSCGSAGIRTRVAGSGVSV